MPDNQQTDFDDAADEINRITRVGAKKARVLARWENVYRMWQEGRTYKEIGEFIGRSASTANKLLRRAAAERRKQPGFTWPRTTDGKPICDVAHSYPVRTAVDPLMPGLPDRPAEWHHPHARKIKLRGIYRGENLPPRRAYCPVCKKAFSIGRTLVEVFANETKNSK